MGRNGAVLSSLWKRKDFLPQECGGWGDDMKKAMTLMLAAALLMLLCAGACAQAAVVNNGSDPASRLNMRTAPGTDASSLGRFSSGTPVEIIADAGNGWSEVRIGGGMNSLHGYMKTEFLSGSAPVDARESRKVASPYGTPSVVLRDRPGNSYNAVAMLPVGTQVTVIGVSGDFYYVQIQDASVGCLASSELK